MSRKTGSGRTHFTYPRYNLGTCYSPGCRVQELVALGKVPGPGMGILRTLPNWQRGQTRECGPSSHSLASELGRARAD